MFLKNQINPYGPKKQDIDLGWLLTQKSQQLLCPNASFPKEEQSISLSNTTKN